MHDPWDVKSVRQSNQYQSCMKINGTPLLPPVLSKECRKEMQYYKLLAKEVEKRICTLRPFIDTVVDLADYRTDAPQLLNCDTHDSMFGNKKLKKLLQTSPTKHGHFNNSTICSKLTIDDDPLNDTTSVRIDVNVSINETISGGRPSPVKQRPNDPHRTTPRAVHQKPKKHKTTVEVPERDCDYIIKSNKELFTDVDALKKSLQDEKHAWNKLNCLEGVDTDDYIPLKPSGPSSKSFTGSLQDLHAETLKEAPSTLVRQSSYTVLTPSPQLLAHLQVQSISTGIEMGSISMSESLSNKQLEDDKKSRRSWDLESAKVKWSSMALELTKTPRMYADHNARGVKKYNSSPPKQQSSSAEQTKKLVNKHYTPKKEPIQKTKSSISPQNTEKNSVKEKESFPFYTNKTKNNLPVKTAVQKKRSLSPKRPNGKAKQEQPVAEDPATKVRELYDKIQKQQLEQMASLVEKQKREQLLLQQVFEEQNSMLFKQLKTICPTSPIEVKQAWGEKEEAERGPVSLDQLLNIKSPKPNPPSEQFRQQSSPNPVLESPINIPNAFVDQCDSMLKKSRDLTSTFSKSKQSRATNIPQDTTHSLTVKNASNASRKLFFVNNEASEGEPEILTDRTNDTLADLNVTFPTDNSEQELTCMVDKATSRPDMDCQYSDGYDPGMLEQLINLSGETPPPDSPVTPQEREAATKIVAYAKGYLVRRLMRTERVQATVATIRDALLCALELHQDRQGIRGADVDLHRRLIQQITAACYSLHDTFIASSPAERCSIIAADRERRNKPPVPAASHRTSRQREPMKRASSVAEPGPPPHPAAEPLTNSYHETISSRKRKGASPQRRIWR